MRPSRSPSLPSSATSPPAAGRGGQPDREALSGSLAPHHLAAPVAIIIESIVDRSGSRPYRFSCHRVWVCTAAAAVDRLAICFALAVCVACTYSWAASCAFSCPYLCRAVRPPMVTSLDELRPVSVGVSSSQLPRSETR